MQEVLARALVFVGAGLVVVGCGLLIRASRRPHTWLEWALAYLYVFRPTVVGLCLVGAGLAWAAELPWVVAAAVCVAIGELLESSYYIGVLRWGQRRGSIPSPSS